MITTTLTDLPTPPQSTDPANFNVRADAFVTALDTFQPEMNMVIGEINSTATDVNNDATAADASAVIAVGAANYKGDWVAGTYNQGESVSYSGLRYISKINGNTDTPPSANWLSIGTASATQYDNATSGLTATTVQAAVDELQAEKVGLAGNETIAGVKTFSSSPVIPTGDATGEAVNYNQILGLGQTPQNVTASRATGVVYTNTTGRPIVVMVSGSNGSVSFMDLFVDGIVVCRQQIPASSGNYHVIGVVPNGSTYQVTVSAGSLLGTIWAELR